MHKVKTRARNTDEEIAALKREVEELRKAKEVESQRREVEELRAKGKRTVEEEIQIKVRTDAAVVAASLPDSLQPFCSGSGTAIWLTQSKAILPPMLRRAWDDATTESQLAPIWGQMTVGESVFCEAQDKRLYGIVLGALTNKDIEKDSQHEARELFDKIHSNRADSYAR